jgi:glutamyl-tRNA synthetase
MYARHYGGQCILRIEDTDLKRTVEGAVEEFRSSLGWMGIDWDEGPDVGGPVGPYVQTQRAELYQEWANWLLENEFAYKCYCTPDELAEIRLTLQKNKQGQLGYDRRCRYLTADERERRETAGKGYTLRFKMPLDGTTIVPDLIRGDISFENSLVTDHVILKSNGLPTYHLAHVIDDHFMGITHVTRGVEWISTAPLHVNLFEAFGWDLPVYVHLPLILNPSGKGKLSKRTQAFTDSGQQVLVRVEEFRDAGYLPEALVNFLANIGWSFGDDREKFTMDEAIERFDLADINPAETKMPYEKLDWLNGQYIQDMGAMELAEALKPYLEEAGYEVDLPALAYLTPSLSVRIKKLTDATPLLAYLYVDKPLEISAEDLTAKQLDLAAAERAFTQAREFISAAEPFDLETIGAGLIKIGEANTSNGKAGPFLGRMRLAMTGQKVSPPLYESILAMGHQRSLEKLDEALTILDGAF